MITIAEGVFIALFVCVCLFSENSDFVELLRFYFQLRSVLDPAFVLLGFILLTQRPKPDVEAVEETLSAPRNTLEDRRNFVLEERRIQYPDGTIVEERKFSASNDIAS